MTTCVAGRCLQKTGVAVYGAVGIERCLAPLLAVRKFLLEQGHQETAEMLIAELVPRVHGWLLAYGCGTTATALLGEYADLAVAARCGSGVLPEKSRHRAGKRWQKEEEEKLLELVRKHRPGAIVG